MVNLPLPENLEKECKKAAKTLRSFRMPEKDGGFDSMIPIDVIERAKGLVIMTVAKAGFLFSGRIGFGLVVARLPDGSWSAPSAIGTAAFGAGLQIGAELTDFVIILNNQRAVDAFSHGGNVSVGGNLSVALGPTGRDMEGAAMATMAAIYSYSKTKGLFAGISIEGTVFIERADANEKFYGKKVKARELLSGSVASPAVAQPLYDAIRLREDAAREASQPFAPPYTPHAYQGQTSSAGFGAAPPPLPTRRNFRARALYSFAGMQEGDLSFNAGDIIEITQKTNSQTDWWKGTTQGRSGTFPANYVELV